VVTQTGLICQGGYYFFFAAFFFAPRDPGGHFLADFFAAFFFAAFFAMFDGIWRC
jgi:hypothetical protein